MATEKDVMEALKSCVDPELGANIVDLGFIYGVEVIGETVRIKMTLTTVGCPLASMFRTDVVDKVGKLKGVKKVDVEFVWDPPWTPAKISPEVRKQLGIEEEK